MEKNAVIKMNLDTLLSILEARAFIRIFVKDVACIFSGNLYNVYNNDEIMKYRDYRVTGLSSTVNITSIQIEEAEY